VVVAPSVDTHERPDVHWEVRVQYWSCVGRGTNYQKIITKWIITIKKLKFNVFTACIISTIIIASWIAAKNKYYLILTLILIKTAK
jgi:hypothetical protein